MAVRITGLNSGLDTDSIVQELVKSYSGQKEAIEKKQTKLEWKQDAWKELNTKIYSFYSTKLSNLRYASAYNSKATTSSDETKVKVSASNNAVIGSQSIEVEKLAQAGYLTGSQLKTTTGGKVESTTNLSALGITGNQTIEVEVGGKTKRIGVNGSDTIQKLVDKFKDAGLSASFDKNSQRLFINSKETGEAANFNIVSDDITTLVGSAVTTTDGEKANIASELSKLGIEKNATFKVTVAGKEETIEINKDDHIYDLVDKFKAIGLEVTFKDYDQTFTINRTAANSDFKIEPVSDDPDDEQVRANWDALQKLGIATVTHEGTAEVRTRRVSDTLSKLGLLDEAHGGDAVKIDGQDSVIKLNGAEYTSSGNSYSINGLNISAMAETKGTAVSLTTSTDTKGIYDTVKNFFKEYNELIKEIDTLYNADNAKGYEPLTDDEKDKLSDKEIEKWEKKIKDSLLRRDSTLGSVADVMKTALAKSYTINGKSFSLASFGISTQSYLSAGKNEKNTYHIDGDSDDTLTKSNSDKLMKALTEDPDSAAEFFSQLIKGTYEALDKKMRSTSLSSAYVVYNDKQITKDLKEYDSKIDKWEDKVKYYEDFYYKKFSGMEKALANLQSSQNSLSMLLGQ